MSNERKPKKIKEDRQVTGPIAVTTNGGPEGTGRQGGSGKKNGSRKKRLPKPRDNAIVIKPGTGKSYAEVLGKIKEEVNL